MDVITELRRRRPRDQLTWQQLRDWQLRDLQRFHQWPRGHVVDDARTLRGWFTTLQFNEPVGPQSKHQEFGINDSTLLAREWSPPQYSYLPLPMKGGPLWEAASLAGFCMILLLLPLALAALLEMWGCRVLPRRCIIKSSLDMDEPPTTIIEPPLLADLPPPYSDTQLSSEANLPTIANYTPLANEQPPPAYSEVFVQIPNLKLFYENETQDVSEDGNERLSSEINETVVNDDVVINDGISNSHEGYFIASTNRGVVV